MNRPILKLAFALVVFTFAVSTALADVKIKTKTTTGGMSYQTTTWIKGARMRTSPGFSLDSIEQCDLNRSVMINDKGKLYLIQSKGGQNSADAAKSPDMPQSFQRPEKSKHEGKHGVTTYTTTVVDTGERKEMFGFTARHLKLSTVAESSSDACNPVKMKMESDGWYIDLDANPNCNQGASPDQSAQTNKSDCGDEVQYKTVGEGKPGFPVLQTVTTTQQDGKPQTMTMEVIELSQETLDAKLFDAPAEYKQVNSYPELVGATRNSSADAQIDPSSFLDQFGIDPGSANGMRATIEPKQPGTIRIGVASPENKSDRKFFAMGLRDKLIAALGGGNVQAIPLRAHSEADAEPEAKKYECDYLLFTDIETLKKSTPGGMLGKMTKMAGANPMNDKYEGKIDFKLYVAGDGSPVTASSESAKSGGGVSAMGVLQLGMMFSPMMMGGGMMGGGMSSMLLSRLQGTGTSMLMQGLMGGGMNGLGGMGEPLDKKEDALLVQLFGQEAKSVAATVQKRHQ